MIPIVLSIAGSDPSGGAGIQADLKVFQCFGVYGTAVPTVLTAQNTTGIKHSHCLDGEFVAKQIETLLEDCTPVVAKIGALGCSEIIEALSSLVNGFSFPLIIDPIITSSDGELFLDSQAISLLCEKLFPQAFLVTPNLPEASCLAQMDISNFDDMHLAAERISQMGPKNVLIKGGHLPNNCCDLLWSEGKVTIYRHPYQHHCSVHGTGCALSAAITACIALGKPLEESVAEARNFIISAIRGSFTIGRGRPVLDMRKPDSQ